MYLDDFLLWNLSKEQLRNFTNVTTNLLTNLGLTVNWEVAPLSFSDGDLSVNKLEWSRLHSVSERQKHNKSNLSGD